MGSPAKKNRLNSTADEIKEPFLKTGNSAAPNHSGSSGEPFEPEKHPLGDEDPFSTSVVDLVALTLKLQSDVEAKTEMGKQWLMPERLRAQDPSPIGPFLRLLST